MQFFLKNLSIQRIFIKRGLSLNYKNINLSNNFFGTSFFLNNRSFYSFNRFLFKSFLYNVKSIYFFNIQNIFCFDFLLKIFRSKLFFSIYFFLPLFSKKLTGLINQFKSICKTLFFFSTTGPFVKNSANGFFWNYFSFINPYIKTKSSSWFLKKNSYKSPFFDFLLADFRSRSFLSKFYTARLNTLSNFKNA